MAAGIMAGAAVGLAGCAAPREWRSTLVHRDPPQVLAMAQVALLEMRPALPVDGPVIEIRRPDAPSTPEAGSLTLDRALAEALSNNLDVHMARKSQVAANQLESIARAEFDPQVAGSVLRSQGRGGLDGNVELTKKFLTGTEVHIEGGTAFFDNTARRDAYLTDERDRQLVVRVTQPLLRGANWTVNRSGIELGRLAARDADALTQATVLEMLRAAESTYWTTAVAREMLEHEAAGVRRAEELIEVVKTKRDAGAATRLDQLEAEASLAAARDSQLKAKKRYADGIDTLWHVLGRTVGPTPSSLVFQPIATAKLPTDAPSPEISYQSAIRLEPTVALLANDVKRQEIEWRKAKNEILPALDAEMNWSNGSLFGSDGFAASNRRRSAADDSSWMAVLRVSIPWTFRAERAQLKAAAAEFERSQLARDNGFRELRREIFETCREIGVCREEVSAAATGVEVNVAKYDEQFHRYQEGLSTVRDLREAEAELRQARAVELDARLRLIVATVMLARQDGSIARRHGLVL